MEFVTLLVIALLCLLSENTRTFSLVLFVLLFLAFPLTFIAALAILIYYFNKPKRMKLYEPPKLPRSN
jgi:hypothetical protein